MKTLSQRDKRTLVLTAAAAVLIVGYFMVLEPALASYNALRSERDRLHSRLERLGRVQSDLGAARFGQMSRHVPVFDMPQAAAEQGVLFRDALTRQLEQAGIQVRTLQLRDSRTQRRDGYAVLTVQSQGQCTYRQIVQLLAALKQNPYYVGIEKLSLRVDTRNREQMSFELTVFTYAN